MRVARQNDAGIALAAADERPLQVEQAGRRSRSIASRTQSRRSVATWSLRLRPVCSLRPTSPRRSISARSMCMWMSSSSSSELEVALLNFLADLLQAGARSAGTRPR